MIKERQCFIEYEVFQANSDEEALGKAGKNPYVVIERGNQPGSYHQTRIPLRQSSPRPQESAA
ncbi:hypothetical protein C4564_02440 [Candidatus Microgenomates bacterium]|nr:MAG: hypothetical protein C4564_02440 [Candidatus Microgenomates bacterium]